MCIRDRDDVVYADSAYDCVTGAHAAVIVTEWDAFRAIDLERVRSQMAAPVLVDLRNVYRADDVRKHGFVYVDVGRTAAGPLGAGDVERAA